MNGSTLRARVCLLFQSAGPVTDIDGFDFSDFEVTGYKPHGAIKMQMAV
jgi:thymidylate synthase